MSNKKKARKKTGPTPKRREAEKQNMRPLVQDRKKLSKEQKAERKRKRDEMYARQRAALDGKGPERYLPLKDQGVIRRKTRDFIDSRWTVTEFLLPIMFLALIPSMILPRNSVWAYAPILTVYAFMAFGIIEIIFTHIMLKRRLSEHYPTREIPSGQGFYVAARMLMVRRWRQPDPPQAETNPATIPNTARSANTRPTLAKI